MEQNIIEGLVTSDTYARKVLPFLKNEYFQDFYHEKVFEVISQYYEKYNDAPTKAALLVDCEKVKGITDDNLARIKENIEAINFQADRNESEVQWLVDNTETFCQDRAVILAIQEGIHIIQGEGDKDKGALPQILSDALSVSFDSSIGHDYLDDAEKRYEFYTQKEDRLPFDLDYLNRITDGGLPRKSLTIAMAGTGVGKSLFMSHCAAYHITMGKNVLYITLEMSEERIAERIDANLMNVNINELKLLSEEAYMKKLDRVKNKATGKIVVREYPTASAHAGHFRHLINELKIKKNFIPDVIYVDYLNICASSRVRGNNASPYAIVKSIAEEVRGLAVEFNVPVVTATQVNRSGFTNSDFGLEDTSESWGMPVTADYMFAMISTEELEEHGQIMFKQLKNRYGDTSQYKRFVVGIDRPKMKFYDVEQTAQEDIIDDTPVFDNTESGQKLLESFKGFK